MRLNYRVRESNVCRTGSVLLLSAMLLLSSAAALAGAPRVVVSTKPLHSLLSGLMHGVAEPGLLVDGSGVPWTFVPDRDDLGALAAADIVIWSGTELEPGLAPAIASLGPDSTVVEVLGSDLVKVLPARSDDYLRDPFFWLDSRNMLLLLDAFARLLIDTDPVHAAAYERNWQRVSESLSELDRALEYGYRDVSGVPVFFYHDTHQYFEQAYAMNVIGTVAAAGDTDAVDTARLLETRAGILAAGRSCLFTERGLEESHLGLLLDGTGTKRVELDSLGVGYPAGPDMYADMMRENFAAISSCVRAARPQAVQTAHSESPDPSRSPARLRPRYLMMDQYGRAVSHDDFSGRLQLIYFGYTYCPDVCPTSLAVMVQALKLLGEDADQVQPIFITVDPERDTPALLKEYLAWFDPRLLGLSASPEVTRRTAELFRARYERVPAESGDPARYTMDHSASLFLLGRRGEFVTKFAHGLPAREVAERLQAYLRD